MTYELGLELAPVRSGFLGDGYTRLPGLLGDSLLAELSAEVLRLESLAIRRDFTMACMNNSPRHMSTVSGQVIAEQSRLIPTLYADAELLALLTAVTGLKLCTVADPVERHVLNILDAPGDTHSAHVDDYPVALVVFLEAPDAVDGGMLEFVPHTDELGRVEGPGVRREHHGPGDAYVLRSDRTAHRVAPLRRAGTRRVALNFAYTTPEWNVARTPSAALLYG